MNSATYALSDSKAQTNRHSSARQRIESTIRAFENRLDDKIKSVFKEMMAQSKIQNIRLPVIDKQDTRTPLLSEQSIPAEGQVTRNTRTLKSKSHHVGRLSESIRNVLEDDRPQQQQKRRNVGQKKFGKPKWLERRPDILPKHIRNDPFCQPMPVSISDINKGLINLLNKGVISKDIDISTAFERGQPPIRTRGAVLHHFEERLVKDMVVEKEMAKEHTAQEIAKIMNKQPQKITLSGGWALTGIDGQSIPMRAPSIEPTEKYQSNAQKLENMKDLHIYHIEFRNFCVVDNDPSYIELRRNQFSNWGGIRMVIRAIEKFLEKYFIKAVFADGKRILTASTSLKRISERAIIDCLVGKTRDKLKLKSIKNIASAQVKLKMSALLINTVVRMHLLRKQYILAQKRKQNQFKIVNWISSRLLKKKFKARMENKKIQKQREYEAQQAVFVANYQKIKEEKHFEIHVPNSRYDVSKQQLVQKMNVEITRIFNVREPNLNIIYVCPFPLSADITNYYYKILELGEVTNFKDRITFVESDPKNIFHHRFENSKKLYYCSEALRKISNIVGHTPAYIVSSYPIEEDCMLSLFLKIPVMSNYHIAQSLSPREASILKFKELELSVIDSIRIDGGNSISQLDLIGKLSRFSNESKCRKLIMKINNTSCGVGLAIINMPLNNMEDMYGKAMPVNSTYYNDTKLFFHDLLKHGGVIEKTELNFAPIVASVFVSPAGTYEIMGTFDKINNNFTNIGYSFPQQSIYHQYLLQPLDKLLEHLAQKGYYGYLDINMYVDSQKNVFFERIQCHLTKLTASLFYFRYLMGGRFENNGKYTTAITETINFDETGKTQPIEKLETRTYIYSPFIMHFGLSQAQIKNFFQLCRIQGVSFDLERKYGSTFILIDTLKSAVGLLTTGRNTRASVKLMTTTLAFLIKQNQKIANDPTREKELRFKEKCNIASVKSRFDELLSLLKTEQEDADMN